MSKITLLVILIITSVLGLGQDKAAYTIFDSNGKRVSYTKMLNALNEKDVVLFGQNNQLSAKFMNKKVYAKCGEKNDT